MKQQRKRTRLTRIVATAYGAAAMCVENITLVNCTVIDNLANIYSGSVDGGILYAENALIMSETLLSRNTIEMYDGTLLPHSVTTNQMF
jgi:hypothetical protein